MFSLETRFDYLLAVEPCPEYSDASPLWIFECDCGTKFKASLDNIRRRHLSGERVSCGCKPPSANKHYDPQCHLLGTKHPIYQTWKSLLVPNTRLMRQWDATIGGHPPTLCEAWKVFPVFYDAVAPSWIPNLILARLDPKRGYEPGNIEWLSEADCEARYDLVATILNTTFGWMTPVEYCRVFDFTLDFVRTAIAQGHDSIDLTLNRRAFLKNTRFINTPNGRMTLMAASVFSGIPPATLHFRVNNRWPAHKLFTPPSYGNRCSSENPRIFEKQSSTNTRVLTPEGFISATEASKRSGIPRATILNRLRRGWPQEQVLNPVGTRLKR